MKVKLLVFIFLLVSMFSFVYADGIGTKIYQYRDDGMYVRETELPDNIAIRFDMQVLIGSDNLPVVASSYSLSKLMATGDPAWRISFEEYQTHPMAMDAEGNVYFTDSGKQLTKIDPLGEVKWTLDFSPPNIRNVTIIGENIYLLLVEAVFPNYSYSLQALNFEGNRLWDAQLTETANEQRIRFLSGKADKLFILLKNDISLVWKYSLDGALEWQYQAKGSFSVGSHDEAENLYLANWQSFFALDADGNEYWRITLFPNEAGDEFFPADLQCDKSGDLVLLAYRRGGYDNKNHAALLQKYSPQGERRWTTDFGNNLLMYDLSFTEQNRITALGVFYDEEVMKYCQVYGFSENGDVDFWIETDLLTECAIGNDQNDNLYIAGYYYFEENDSSIDGDDDEPGCGCF